jgi:hypothetical protein
VIVEQRVFMIRYELWGNSSLAERTGTGER